MASPNGLIDEAKAIIERGDQRGVKLRLVAGLAVRLHCPKFTDLFVRMKREPGDIDLITYLKLSPQVKKLFVEMGYTPDREVLAYFAGVRGGRHIYYGTGNTKIDVFFDSLEMCHSINLKERLGVDYPTIPLAEILLQKMQIAQVNEKDIQDSIVLLREHEVGQEDKETINAKYIAELLSKDWGFHYTVTKNLNALKESLGRYDVLAPEDRSDVQSKIETILGHIEKEPKTTRWKTRARIGTRLKWYREVEEVDRMA